MSESEKATVEQSKAQTGYVKAQTAQLYMDTNVLDPSEVRKSLSTEGDFDIEEIISDDNEFNVQDNTFENGISDVDMISVSGIDVGNDSSGEYNVISLSGVNNETDGNGRVIRIVTQEENNLSAAAVIVLKDGKILCSEKRKKNWCFFDMGRMSVNGEWFQGSGI